MPSNPNSKVDFRDLELKNKISKRYPGKSEGMMAKRDLKRYYHFLETTLKEINLTLSEAQLIVHIFKGRSFMDEEISLLPLQREIIGAIEFEELAQKFSVSKRSFSNKVKNWTASQVLAIADAVGRYYNLANERGSNSSNDLYRVGLVK